MTKRIFYYFLFLIPLFLTSSTYEKLDNSGMLIIQNMFKKSSTITSISYVMNKTERFNGKMISQQSFTKVKYDPLHVYLKQLKPKEGLEVLFILGQNNNQAIVNTNGFPWINLNLDPMGSIMRDKQHHTIYDSGYRHVVSILELLIHKYGKEAESFIRNEGSITYNGRSCWHISFTNPHFKYYRYTLKTGESILSIAAKEKLSEHMILELNPQLGSFSDTKPGQTIVLPNDYSPKLELYIDKELKMPLVMKVFDDKGLYEHYEYNNVIINPKFETLEFDKSYPTYNF